MRRVQAALKPSAVYLSPFGVRTYGERPKTSTRCSDRHVVAPTAPYSLLLRDIDPAVLDVAWGHAEHVSLSLARVAREQNRSPPVLPRVALDQLVGPYGPRARSLLVGLQPEE
jgi:hypothetical protein